MLRGAGEAGGGSQMALSQAPHRSGWLGWLPVSALEDNMSRWSLMETEAEEALEVDTDDLDAVSDDLARYTDLPIVFCCPRHKSLDDIKVDTIMQTWRMRERMKTVSVALVICLNVGVDPPDVTKTQPCARQECWVDPLTLNPQRALETIGANLQRQYERWQPRARYRQSPDPTVEEVRRLATGLRRSARDERVLFHYNGHGVPKPTANGEIWVFNRSYTQYIPLSIYDLQTWMGSPSIYVWDCNNAGIIVESFKNFAVQHDKEYMDQVMRNGTGTIRPGASLHPSDGEEIATPPSFRNCIQLAACSKDQLLPMNPELAAADLFTACLTTPIKMALRWFVMTNDLGHLAPEVKMEQLEKIPGQFGDRRTMLGELNWIFTAITDTIAWNTLPRDTFQKLFRQDLLVASLFRNFLLAERIMKANDCTPISHPKLPDTHQHQMWEAWDLALDICLSQLKGILEDDKPYVPSSFFEEQLTAFDVWLSHGDEERTPPEQLPIVLQVLLSQAHRLRALELLGRFLDLGSWAVNLALSVGIFPYVLKLLQSSQRELRPLLVFIWAKILAVDPSCQHDLVRDQSHKYFLTVLQDPAMAIQHKTWAVFVLSSVVRNYKQGQDEAVAGQLISICLNELEDRDAVYRQWLVICLATCWDNHEEARGIATRDNAPDKLETLLSDDTAEVRAAAVMALGTFINSCRNRREHENTLDQNIAMRLIQNNLDDGSPLVRKELVVAMQHVVSSFLNNFLSLIKSIAEEDEGYNSPNRLSANHISRISSEDKLSRQVVNNRRSVIGTHPTQAGLSGSVTDLSSNSSNVSSLTTPRRGRKSVLLSPSHQAGSLASLSTLACYGPGVTSKSKPFYQRVLGSLMVLERDPDPEVASMARSVLDGLHTKMMMSSGDRKTARSQSQADLHSTSLPGSPSRPSFTLGSSPPPPSGHNTTLPNLSMTMSTMSTLSNSNVSSDKTVNTSPVTTNFVSWSSAHFSASTMRLCEDGEDQESDEFWSRQWMYDRNNLTRARAAAERESLDQGTGRLDESLHVYRVSSNPRVVEWEAFTVSSLYLATQDSVHHYSGGSGHVSWTNNNPRVSNISSLVTCNSHVSANVMAGSDDGCVRVWSQDRRQVTGWVVMPELVPLSLSGPRVSCGLQMAWSQHNMSLITGGDSRNIRIWDCHSEMKVCDIPTQLDTCVTCIQTGNRENKHVAAVSFGDGHVKLFDTRTRGCVMTVREHKQMVLGIKLQGGSSGHSLLSGCADGVVKVWDLRRQSSLMSHHTGQPSISLDIHPSAALVAVAHTNGQLSLHSTHDGRIINVIRQPHTRHQHSLTCLRFHPNLLQLAAASSDNSVSVYGYRKY